MFEGRSGINEGRRHQDKFYGFTADNFLAAQPPAQPPARPETDN
jgi:hypothetical protein